jgi:hypothetical protein
LTVSKFIGKAEGYYTAYTAEQKAAVFQWLSKRSEKAISLIWAEVLKAFSPVYKTPPCIKELEDAWTVVCRDRRDELRQPALPAPEDTSDVADPETVDEVLEKLNEKLRWR